MRGGFDVVLAPRDRRTPQIALDDLPAVDTGEQPVVDQLKTADAHRVDVGPTEDAERRPFTRADTSPLLQNSNAR